jgi:hypothetical protein
MLDTLYAVERELPALLQDEGAWKSLYVDYHPPLVERLWLPWGSYRINLHRIHPCARDEALFHPIRGRLPCASYPANMRWPSATAQAKWRRPSLP